MMTESRTQMLQQETQELPQRNLSPQAMSNLLVEDFDIADSTGFGAAASLQSQPASSVISQIRLGSPEGSHPFDSASVTIRYGSTSPLISRRGYSTNTFVSIPPPRVAPGYSTKELDNEIDYLIENLAISCAEELQYGRVNSSHNHGRIISPIRAASSLSKAKNCNPYPNLNSTDDTDTLKKDNVQSLPQNSVEDKIPHLASYVKVLRNKRLGLKNLTKQYLVIRNSTIYIYTNHNESQRNLSPLELIELRGCYVEHDICPSQERYGLKLYVPLTRSNLPIRSALEAGNKAVTKDNDLITRLRNRASFLSLTSLAGFIAGGLNGAASFIAGLLYELELRFSDERSFSEWYSLCRVAGSLNTNPEMDEKILTIKAFEEELLDIQTYLEALKPIKTTESSNKNKTISKSIPIVLSRHACQFLPASYWTSGGINLSKSGILPGTHETGHATWTNTSQRTHNPQNKSTPSLFQANSEIHEQQHSIETSRSLKNNQYCQITEVKEEIIRKIVEVSDRIEINEEATVLNLKLNYISLWQSLYRQGMHYFIARFSTSAPLSIVVDSKKFSLSKTNGYNLTPFQQSPSASFCKLTQSTKDEALVIGSNRIFRCDLSNGMIKSSWKLNSVQGWHVNYELNEIILYIAPLTENLKANGRVNIKTIKVSIRTVVEILGGNAFLNLRSPSKNQDLDEETFYKLTGSIHAA